MIAPATVALDTFLDAHFEELVAFRRQVHARPERSHEEFETTALVAQRLEVAGLHPLVLPSGTGLVCDIGASDGTTVALRADLDALSMLDEKNVHYRSQHEGVAHACGHDVHTTMVLGAGLALARLLAARDAAGRVRLLFQPAEEAVPGGALDVIEAGGLDGVDAIFGLHCDPKLDTGQVGVRVGGITSAADLIEIRLHGPGGHTARPKLTADLVAIAGRVAAELPSLVRAREPELNVVFGAIHAGQAPNVIPSLAVVSGSARTPDRGAWDGAAALVTEVLDTLVTPLGATFELVHRRGAPPVNNDARATALLDRAARRVLGDAAVVPTIQSAGGDDFSWYLERVPGAYARLGVHDPSSDRARLDLHASMFDVDERAIAVGIRVLVQTSLDVLDDAVTNA
ncbi:MAG TPA: amidohydrolase [Acidimicrobiia bacterium]|nr:amidohydrolase [Acidimicrobiia bacterium]